MSQSQPRLRLLSGADVAAASAGKPQMRVWVAGEAIASISEPADAAEEPRDVAEEPATTQEPAEQPAALTVDVEEQAAALRLGDAEEQL